MKLRCPACDQTFEDNNKERLIPNQGYLYNVCPACHLAYLKVRVMKGDRLGLADLHHIGQVRKKFKSTS
jgi:Zn finger protein HypA/HybF involved in hydrogenase expression